MLRSRSFALCVASSHSQNERGKRKDRAVSPFASQNATRYFLAAASSALASTFAPSPAFLRLSQPNFFWNFSTRPVVSTNFILPVKNGWHAEQISTLMFFFVLRVVNLLPQPQVTVVSSYLG